MQSFPETTLNFRVTRTEKPPSLFFHFCQFYFQDMVQVKVFAEENEFTESEDEHETKAGFKATEIENEDYVGSPKKGTATGTQSLDQTDKSKSQKKCMFERVS